MKKEHIEKIVDGLCLTIVSGIAIALLISTGSRLWFGSKSKVDNLSTSITYSRIKER